MRRLLSIVSALGLVVLTFVSGAAPASADPNSGIVVEVTGIENGSGPGGQLVVGDRALVSGTWDATNADPVPGDEFTIGLPPEFGFDQSVPFQLTGEDVNGDPIVWAECLSDPTTSTATCEMTDLVEQLPEDVKGVWEFEITVNEATTAEEVLFDLNGTPGALKLPGEGGIDDGIELPDEVTKTGVMNDNNWSMTWTVDIPGANLVNAGGNVAHIRDTFGDGHVLCDPTGFRIQTVRGDEVLEDVTDLVDTLPVAGDAGFQIALNAPEAGFDANVVYRMTYTSCTDDGEIDPAGTTYDNDMQIDGWGESGHGVGHVENRPWHLDLSKSGSVLGGGDRNGKIRWTVVVPGDELVNQDSFTFSESFGAGHELCSDTISNISIVERYGPSGQRDTNITNLLTQDVTSQSSSGFDITYSIDDPDFEFKASDWRYIITYDTCVTETDLPSGGTTYSNEATVDGKVTGGSATVPGRKSDKTGSINGSARTIDGVDHLPQTTLDWTVTIPGREIEDRGIENVFNLTDTLSDTHQVCEAGDPTGGLASQLNLRVEARDQIDNGGLATQPLTDETTVVQDGQELTFSLNETDLPLPGDEQSDGFSREYQYVFTYTTCTASGGMDAPGTQYGNEIEGWGERFHRTITQNNRGSGTGQGQPRGTVAITKALTDNTGAAFVPPNTTFRVHVKEISPDGSFTEEYDLDVPVDGEPVSGFNSRGRGWTIELTEPAFPSVSGVVFGDPVFTASDDVAVSADGKTATATITPATNIAVALTNTAQLGSVEIVKEVEGAAADLVPDDQTYRVTATIDTSALGNNVPAQADRVLELVAGEPVVLEDVPIGATVEFTEVVPADDDILTWGEPRISPESIVVTADSVADPARVTVTNSVERTVGTFDIVKNVTGAQADNPAIPAEVTVTATWTEEGGTEQSKELTVPTDGTAVPLGEDLLIGTEVTLTETPLQDGSSIAWGAPVWSGTGVDVDGESAVVTIGRDDQARVTLENLAATSVAGISIVKGVAGEAADEVPAGTEFPVTASWTDEDDVEQSVDLMINEETPTPLGVDLPAGTVVTLTEGERPGFPTVIWDSITITGDDVTDAGDGSAQIVVSDQQGAVTLVTVTNEATWAPGTLSIAKAFEGVSADHADIPDSFTATATWTVDGEEHTKDLVVPADGTAVDLGEDVPHATEVTLSELTPADTASFTWQTPTWAGDGVEARADGTAIVTISAATTVAAELTNTAAAKLGSLTLTKELSGKGADAVPAKTKFPVTLTWTDLLGQDQQRDVSVKAGKSVRVKDLPIGTKVKIVEDGRGLDGVVWEGATWSSDDASVEVVDRGKKGAVITVTGDAGTAVSVAIDNSYDLGPDGGVDDNDDEVGDGDLSDTGSDASPGLIALGALAIVVGGLAVVMARRRRGITSV